MATWVRDGPARPPRICGMARSIEEESATQTDARTHTKHENDIVCLKARDECINIGGGSTAGVIAVAAHGMAASTQDCAASKALEYAQIRRSRALSRP
eukprot:scaffold205736_cov32-Tisochrysis_lutea.AAC.1